MGSRSLGTLPEEYVERLDEEATALGLSRTKYVQQRLEAGRLLFDCSDTLNAGTLSDLVDQEDLSVNTELQTADSDIADTILANLPTDETKALEQEELRVAVFGNKKEQLKEIEKVLKKLYQQEKIDSPAFDSGYIKKNE